MERESKLCEVLRTRAASLRIYVKETMTRADPLLVSLELAPPRVTGVSAWVTLTERLCTVPVPSPWKVRMPCVLDEKVNLPSIGVRLGLNPGGSATRHVFSPVET